MAKFNPDTDNIDDYFKFQAEFDDIPACKDLFDKGYEEYHKSYKLQCQEIDLLTTSAEKEQKRQFHKEQRREQAKQFKADLLNALNQSDVEPNKRKKLIKGIGKYL